MPTNKNITLAVLASKIDALTEVVERVDITLNGKDDEPGIKGRLKILEDHEETEVWYFRSLWAAIVASGFVQVFIRH